MMRPHLLRAGQMENAPRSPRRNPHDWNSLENYVLVHEKRLAEHPLVILEASLLQYASELKPHPLYDQFVAQGLIVCRNGLHLEVHKRGQIDRTRLRRVRMYLYSYNAWFPGGHSVLRYDNQHVGHEDIYHRHQFDPHTGIETNLTYMERHQFPVMHQVLDELMALFPLHS